MQNQFLSCISRVEISELDFLWHVTCVRYIIFQSTSIGLVNAKYLLSSIIVPVIHLYSVDLSAHVQEPRKQATEAAPGVQSKEGSNTDSSEPYLSQAEPDFWEGDQWEVNLPIVAK